MKHSPLTFLVSLALCGCMLPLGTGLPDELTVGGLARGGAARLFPLDPAAGAVSVPLGARAGALMALYAREPGAERLAVTIAPVGEAAAYRTLAQATGAAPRPAPFEARLRRWEAGLPVWGAGRAAATARPYKLKAVEADDRDSFWVITEVEDGETQDVQVAARAAYVGSRCYVYLDESLTSGAWAERAREIGEKFDRQIHPTNTRLFGEPLPGQTAGDPRVTLLVTPRVGDQGDTTIGYFTVRDLFSPADNPDTPALAHSNGRLILYIAANVVARGAPTDHLGTIAHEHQHLIHGSRKVFRPGGPGRPEAVWLDEGLSMYAMEANGYGLSGGGAVLLNHVSEYLRHHARYSLTDWENNPEASAYGAAYLFTTYMVDRLGEGVLSAIIDAPAIDVAGLERVLTARGADFRSLFAGWTGATLLDGTGLSEEPRYQYLTLDLLGTYGGRRLRGVTLERVAAPNTGELSFRPYSARYYYVSEPAGGQFRFGLAGSAFGGLLVAP